jgi:hypothetical protein
MLEDKTGKKYQLKKNFKVKQNLIGKKLEDERKKSITEIISNKTNSNKKIRTSLK